jgi:shikimate dehydrogenase
MIRLSGAAAVAGVVGAPVRHSLSPLIHNAWIAAAGLDAAYVPFAPAPDAFPELVQGLRRSGLRGLNVTLPFKEQALSLADQADAASRQAGAANLLLFDESGAIQARNTDGLGLLAAFERQAPDWRPTTGPVLVLGAGGAARGAVSALIEASAAVRLVNRTLAKAEALAAAFPGVQAFPLDKVGEAMAGAGALINATAAGLGESAGLDLPLDRLPASAVVMDMVYKPLRTGLLQAADSRGLRTVDGLAMLIGQAIPSFEAFFGRPPPQDVDVRALALQALGERERR